MRDSPRPGKWSKNHIRHGVQELLSRAHESMQFPKNTRKGGRHWFRLGSDGTRGTSGQNSIGLNCKQGRGSSGLLDIY
jgi:hypothetical protein